MARVWGAQQFGKRGFSKVVAIKTILPSLAANRQFETMFLDEARVAAGVHHPNVCEIFDLGEDHGVLYLAMEWVNGESLARLIRVKQPGDRKPVPTRLNPRAAARIIADAAAGVHAAHELCDNKGERLDVVHRDVSPQNILVGLDGTVKVTDFGVAKALGSSSEQTSAGQIKGKASYMSPEQAAGARIDRRSDIFALGICLYEAGTGVRPFAGENQLATLKQVIACDFAPPSEIFSGFPPGLEAITLRAMSPDPMARFPTAERMQHALEEWLAQSGQVVSRVQIGAVVRERAGPMVEHRQRAIREAKENAAAAEAMVPPTGEAAIARGSLPSMSDPAASPLASATNLTVPGAPAPSASTLTTKALVAVGGVALLGGAVWLGRSTLSHTEPTPELDAQASLATVTSLLTIETEPKEGVVLKIDGVELVPGVRTVERVGAGKFSTLVVEADGYETRSMRIDSQAPDLITVRLRKLAPQKPNPSPAVEAPSAPKPQPKRPATKAEAREKRPSSRAEPDIPDNPF